ncbi:uncharacterized protein LOC129189463 isoform X4 [Dunckerocampus dactyliophorus]|uniref:uncharacterized protein LOC129189463 isoform X4 n=1 Tax=Dunckerocampus dactyliophorus TaxID=161453 RepID=UPI002404AA78|nr:uncharacterized protein LOC129189463 isoform X4 [Dunckerocampus dactyliophorus]
MVEFEMNLSWVTTKRASPEMADNLSRGFRAQITTAMDAVLRTAVLGITEIFDQCVHGYCMELAEKGEVIARLEMKLQKTELLLKQHTGECDAIPAWNETKCDERETREGEDLLMISSSRTSPKRRFEACQSTAEPLQELRKMDGVRSAFHAQLAAVMDSLLAAAVCEIAKIFDSTLCEQQAELAHKTKEISMLLGKLEHVERRQRAQLGEAGEASTHDGVGILTQAEKDASLHSEPDDGKNDRIREPKNEVTSHDDQDSIKHTRISYNYYISSLHCEMHLSHPWGLSWPKCQREVLSAATRGRRIP